MSIEALPPSFELSVDLRNCNAEVTFNGFPFVFVEEPEDARHAVRINHMLLERGFGVLRLTASRISAEAPSYVHVTISRTLPEPYGRTRLYHCRNVIPNDVSAERPLVRQVRLELDSPFGPWAWEGARPYREEDAPAVRALIERLHRTLAARDVEGFLLGMSLKLRELGRATGRDEGEMTTQLRADYTPLFAGIGSDVSLVPLPLEELILDSRCDGRIVRVVRPNGRPALLLAAGTDRLGFETNVANLDGQWTVVR
jgi:hypothetical protein